MKKIPSLFKRNYEGDYLVRDEVVEGSEWVLVGEGRATEKWDGTACMIRDGELYRRYDRKIHKPARRHLDADPAWVPTLKDYKPCPDGWESCGRANKKTGHWPGWIPVRCGPDEAPYWQALSRRDATYRIELGTYELVGPKISGNPYKLDMHELWEHGGKELYGHATKPPTFNDIKSYLEHHEIEGIVWHHEDGRMVKIKRRDFGLAWPAKD